MDILFSFLMLKTRIISFLHYNHYRAGSTPSCCAPSAWKSLHIPCFFFTAPAARIRYFNEPMRFFFIIVLVLRNNIIVKASSTVFFIFHFFFFLFFSERPRRLWWRNRAARCWSWSTRSAASTWWPNHCTWTTRRYRTRRPRRSTTTCNRTRARRRYRRPRTAWPRQSFSCTRIRWSSLTSIRSPYR